MSEITAQIDEQHRGFRVTCPCGRSFTLCSEHREHRCACGEETSMMGDSYMVRFGRTIASSLGAG